MAKTAARSPEGDRRPGTNGTKHEARVPLDWIVTPPQLRRTINPEHISVLAESIRSAGCQNPPIVYWFTPEAFAQYLVQIKEIWGDDCHLADFESHEVDGQTYYYVVVAGACRTRAFRLIRDEGCNECIEEHGKEDPYQCFERHFGSREIKVRLDISNDPEQAFRDMFAENTYQAPSPAESAYGLGLYYKWAQRRDRALTMTAFAGMVGFSQAKISDSIQYLNLPEYVRDAVEKKGFPYGLAIQLTRLVKAGCFDRQLEDWYIRMVTRRKTVKAWDEEVTRELRRIRQSQATLDLGAEMQASMEKLARIEGVRRPVMLATLLSIYDQLQWMRAVLGLFEEGRLGTADSPFTHESVTKGMRAIAAMAELVLPHLTWLNEQERLEMGEPFTGAVAEIEKLVGKLAVCERERGEEP